MWPSASSLLAALAAATPRTPPTPGQPPWPHGVYVPPALPTPTPWSNASSVAAALARVR